MSELATVAEEITFVDEVIGNVDDIAPKSGTDEHQAQAKGDIPDKEWKPSRGKVSAGGSFTPGFVKERVQETYFSIALMTAPFMPDTAHALMSVSESAAQIAEDWAQADPKFREFILKFMKTSHGLRFAMANAPVGMALIAEMKNRGNGKGEESGGSSSTAGFPNPPDPEAQMFKRQGRAAKPDAAGFTYKVPENAVLS